MDQAKKPDNTVNLLPTSKMGDLMDAAAAVFKIRDPSKLGGSVNIQRTYTSKEGIALRQEGVTMQNMKKLAKLETEANEGYEVKTKGDQLASYFGQNSRILAMGLYKYGAEMGNIHLINGHPDNHNN